jgi:hypothetical protein
MLTAASTRSPLTRPTISCEEVVVSCTVGSIALLGTLLNIVATSNWYTIRREVGAAFYAFGSLALCMLAWATISSTRRGVDPSVGDGRRPCRQPVHPETGQDGGFEQWGPRGQGRRGQGLGGVGSTAVLSYRWSRYVDKTFGVLYNLKWWYELQLGAAIYDYYS